MTLSKIGSKLKKIRIGQSKNWGHGITFAKLVPKKKKVFLESIIGFENSNNSSKSRDLSALGCNILA